MKILLIGEYSSIHWSLAEGLRKLGHNVTVVSDGNDYKNYQRDVTLVRKSFGVFNTIRYVSDIWSNFRKFKGYDVVQIVNPYFLMLKIDKNLRAFEYLRKHNKKIYLGAFGYDYYWVKACWDKRIFRYSEFDIYANPNAPKHLTERAESWIGSNKESINRRMAEECDGIVACLYEYYKSYENDFKEKLAYISCPINTDVIKFQQRKSDSDKVRFFLGIQTERSMIKGTDVYLKVLKEVHAKYPNQSKMTVAENVPYAEYMDMIAESDVLIDQLYSYSPAMNALSAMAQGMVTLSGGEPEYYDFIGEYENRPIINTFPSEEDIFEKLENLVLNRGQIPNLSIRSREFVEKHHNYIKVAQEYLDFWGAQ